VIRKIVKIEVKKVEDIYPVLDGLDEDRREAYNRGEFTPEFVWVQAEIRTSIDGTMWVDNTIKSLTNAIIDSDVLEDEHKQFILDRFFELFEVLRILGFTKNQITEAIPQEYKADFRREFALIKGRGFRVIGD
jgi:hypothetical protein